jgi:hypothetical protein
VCTRQRWVGFYESAAPGRQRSRRRSNARVPVGTPTGDAEQMRPAVTSCSSMTAVQAANLVQDEEGIRQQEIVQPAPVGHVNRDRRLRRLLGFGMSHGPRCASATSPNVAARIAVRSWLVVRWHC